MEAGSEGRNTIYGGVLTAALLGVALALLLHGSGSAAQGAVPGSGPAGFPSAARSMDITATLPLSPPVALPQVTVRTVTAPPPPPDWVPAARPGPRSPGEADLSILKTAPAVVQLGGDLLYTIVLSNQSEYSATVQVEDVLPLKPLERDVHCDPDCDRAYEVIVVTVNMPGPGGPQPYTETITTVHRLSWPDLVLLPQEVKTLRFSMRVGGQNDGAVLRNLAFARYTLADGREGSASSNETETEVEVPIQPGAGAAVSNEAIWSSDDYGGSGSLDWGDYDHDGYLDLAIGASGGATVYRNGAGGLARLWSSGRYAHDVHWADINGDGLLELIAIGYNWWEDSVQNFIYERSPDGSRFLEIGPLSFADDRLLRVVPNDADGDGDPDLIAVTYRQWTDDGCTLRLYRNDGGSFTAPYRCILDPYATYGMRTENLLSLADYDNDDDLDLVMEVYDYRNPYTNTNCPVREVLWLLENTAGSYTATQPLTVDTFYDCNMPLDVAWGDYDRDGRLDLAAAIPALTGQNAHQVRIYRNTGAAPPFAPAFVLAWPNDDPAPYSVEWGDYDADGDLDLAVGFNPFRIYLNEGDSFDSGRYLAPTEGPYPSLALDLAAADWDNDGDPDLAAANPFAASSLFGTFAAPLNAHLTAIAPLAANDVAWGDGDGNGSLDLLFGAGQNTVGAEMYYNEQGRFADHTRFAASGFGPHSVAFGDMTGDGALDVALGTPAGTQVYLGSNKSSPDWTSPQYLDSRSVAWGDADDDGDLDLAVGADDIVAVFENRDGDLADDPFWFVTGCGDVQSVAWGDLDGDPYPDLAVGRRGRPGQVYRNEGDGTFGLQWTAPFSMATTAVAWADYDGDGDMDLALGNDGQANQIYENISATLSSEPVWTSAEMSRTTALAWGDVDNDGDLDLAVGNNGEADQVYSNMGGGRLVWIWRSAERRATTGLAWGDMDGDGDLDLALSGEDGIGVYENSYARPAHLRDDFVTAMPLAANPPYLALDRPGGVDDAYFFSSPFILAGPDAPTVTITYRLYSPDGTRVVTKTNEPGLPIAQTIFEYSLDGGGTWRPATPLAGSPPPPSTTLRLGQAGVFLWDANTDQAISEDARFRISIIPLTAQGGLRRTLSRAVSPPFRVRGTWCIWPRNPTIYVKTPDPRRGEPIRFVGAVEEGSGVLTFLWDFGDGTTAQWQAGTHTYASNGTYDVTLTVRSEPCPQVKEVYAHLQLVVGTGRPDTYLPFVSRGYTADPEGH